MAKKSEVKKKVLDKTTISRIVRMVPRHEGFQFFRRLGDSTEKVATSLADFVEKMRIVDIRSVNFHFKRQDFAKWIRDIIGDAELSRRISRIRKEAHGEKLRNEIIQIVKGRLEELKEMQTKREH
jgi:hypothetical protein